MLPLYIIEPIGYTKKGLKATLFANDIVKNTVISDMRRDHRLQARCVGDVGEAALQCVYKGQLFFEKKVHITFPNSILCNIYVKTRFFFLFFFARQIIL